MRKNVILHEELRGHPLFDIRRSFLGIRNIRHSVAELDFVFKMGRLHRIIDPDSDSDPELENAEYRMEEPKEVRMANCEWRSSNAAASEQFMRLRIIDNALVRAVRP